MNPYTVTGIIGKPSLGTAEKGATLLDSLAKLFGRLVSLLDS